jgi:hypothetical protein
VDMKEEYYVRRAQLGMMERMPFVI